MEKIIEERLKKSCEIYEYILEKSKDYFITEKEATKIFELSISDGMVIFYENRKKLIDGVNFYKKFYDKIKEVNDMKKLENVIKYFLCQSDSDHMQNKYNIVQALAKICIHRIWSLCYNIHPRIRNDPEEAVRDAMDPLGARQQIFREIAHKIKNEI